MPLVLLVPESLSRLPLCNAEETIGLGKRDIQRGKTRLKREPGVAPSKISANSLPSILDNVCSNSEVEYKCKHRYIHIH